MTKMTDKSKRLFFASTIVENKDKETKQAVKKTMKVKITTHPELYY